MQVDEFMSKFFSERAGRPIKEACDILSWHATRAAGVPVKVSASTVKGLPQLSLADIAKLVTVATEKMSVREAFLILRNRAPDHAESVAVGRMFAKLYACTKRGPTSYYDVVELDRRTLLDAGVSEA